MYVPPVSVFSFVFVSDPAQAQLQQAFLLQQQQQQQATWASASTSHRDAYAPCTTPTARTPSTTFANWSAHEHRRSSSSATGSTRRSNSSYADQYAEIAEEDMEADDEYAVEQLVDAGYSAYSGASSPMRYRSDSSSYAHSYAQPNSNSRHAHRNSDAEHFSTSPSVSTFASSDPFFAAAEAASRQAHAPTVQNSLFAQLGRPSQHSPFFSAHAQANANSVGGAFGSMPMDATRPRYIVAGGLDA